MFNANIYSNPFLLVLHVDGEDIMFMAILDCKWVQAQ